MEEKDTHLSSILGRRRGAVSGLDYEVTPASQDKKDLEIAEFVEQVITGLPDFEDNLKDIGDAIGKGYSALELYWDLHNGKNIVRHMEQVPQSKFIWPDSKTPKLLTKDQAWEGIALPDFKFIFHIHKTKSGNPVRQGVLRVCAWMYLFKNYDIKSWIKFAEVFGMPLRIGRYDSNAPKEDKEALIAAVRSIGSDAAGIISKQTEIEFIEAVKSGGGDFFKKLADFCNAEMSKAILGQTMTTEAGDKGARSLGEVHETVEAHIQRDDCEQIAKTIRRDLIRPLVGFNFGWDSPLPWFKLHYEDPGDLIAEAGRYETHLQSGVPISVNHYREKFRLPAPAEGEEIIQYGGSQPKKDEKLVNGSCPSCAGELLVNSNSVEWSKDSLDYFVDRAIKETDHAPLVDPIRKLLEESQSLEDFRDRLLDVYNDMDPVELGNKMTEALLTAELAGRFESDGGSDA